MNSTHDTADANLSRFVSLITTNELIRSIIEKKIAGVEYDFKDCFGIEKFVAELTQKVGVSLAANAILSTDWLALIAQLEQFIQGIAH